MSTSNNRTDISEGVVNYCEPRAPFSPRKYSDITRYQGVWSAFLVEDAEYIMDERNPAELGEGNTAYQTPELMIIIISIRVSKRDRW